jgi:hypothetical protein
MAQAINIQTIAMIVRVKWKSMPNKLKTWVIAYRDNPNINPSSSPQQALAILIHTHMADGQWRTTGMIAEELGKPLYTVRYVMWVISKVWGYEAVESRSKGYRRVL